MKKTKRILALLLALTMAITCLAACSKKEDPSGDATTKEEATGDTTEDNTVDVPTGRVVTTLPITDEKVTFTCFWPTNTTLANVVPDPNDTYFYQELEKRTNVHIEWQCPAAGEELTAFNLMIASGELTDLIYYQTGQYADGLDAAIDDGYFLDLTELIPVNAPNYYYVINNHSDAVRKATVTDSGRIAAVYGIPNADETSIWYGLYIREDWLDELGLEMPETYDDLEKVLIAFRDEKGVTAPMSLCSLGYNMDNSMSAGYGVTSSFMQVDGTVKYGPIEEGWYKYLTTMNKWYSEGLIDPDYMTISYWIVDTALVLTGQTGVFPSMYSLISSQYYPSMEEGAKLTALTSPKENAGDQLHIRLEDYPIGNAYCISTSCENPEVALQWMDYLFSEEGVNFANYGVEGYTFNYDENGDPQYTEVVTANTELGLDFFQAVSYYCIPAARPVLQEGSRELLLIPEEDLACFNIWGEADTDYLLPYGMGMSSAESQELAKIMADISTYMRENTNKFITGTRPLDEWDDYVNTIKGMNVDRAIELYQVALGRYNDR